MAISLTQAESDFIEHLGLIAEANGMTRITGRTWGLLIICGECLAPSEIAQLLQISRASVSASLKALEPLDLLVLSTRPGDRQTYYGMREQPYVAMMQLRVKQAAADSAFVRDAIAKINRPEARERLRDLEKLYSLILAGYTDIIADLQH